MAEVERINVLDAQARVANGMALLVCAYEDPGRHRDYNLRGSISMQHYRELKPTLPKDTEVIFYCA